MTVASLESFLSHELNMASRYREPLPEEPVGEGPVEVPRRFEGDLGGSGQGPQKDHQAIVVLDAIRHTEVLARSLGPFDEDRVGLLADVDRDEPCWDPLVRLVRHCRALPWFRMSLPRDAAPSNG